MVMSMQNKTVNQIYEDIFLHMEQNNIDLFLCGGASSREHISNRDQLRKRLEKNNKLSIFYPEDMFMELLSRKKYDLLTLEQFLAENSDLIMIVCESPGSFAELGAFVNNERTLDKVVVLIQKRFKNAKSFIMQGPVKHVEAHNKKNVIYFNQNMDDMEYEVNKYLDSKYWFYRNRKYRKYGPDAKEINLIAGQFYFMIILLFFYKEIEIKKMNELIKNIYFERGFSAENFEMVYSAALRRLYKEGMLIKEIGSSHNYYKLTQKGYDSGKNILNNVLIEKRDKIINGIRLKILKDQYY